ncbi:MAG: FAD-dependent oxidoreductase [Luteibaculum sp.]
MFYNAELSQNTSRHILGLFVVGKPALEYQALTGDALKDKILGELDAIYNNQATASYVKHISRDWNSEEFIRSGYMSDHADWRQVSELGKAVGDKVYFAGAEFTDGEDWVSVHTAARSAFTAVQSL